ncbi:hypothetical protein EYZ11_000961 [Aspergillus tanneri]|uniref:Alpha/beta hydrolase fold-3 domain-containing protein n=1 Tax=Aspergillus tanneri TaxID=1220188 RepID=A0A4S3JVW2_9EURO|nr:uncharacterized protein ATNIH1004_000237 [Aspergillus tanneri]KAA8651355.1 hypothetical protein ATNIH1004_000237 [Aspergillus tanneri]THC99592.1 hypothetical protein EYZ11_000961 [Aspergillus tanneri]
MFSPLTYHPFKFFYTTWFLITLPFRVLAILIYYLPSITRSPRTYSQAVAIRLRKIWLKYATAVEYRTPQSLQPGKDRRHYVLIHPISVPVARYFYIGVLGANPAIRPTLLAGFWYPSPPQGMLLPPVVLHFNGAFVLGGARPDDVGWGPLMLNKRMNFPVLVPEYRLSNSRDRTTRFPAALQNALTAYLYLSLSLRARYNDIILSGDSAGGNLVIALLRYLIDRRRGIGLIDLPRPRCALLWSPWVDLSMSGSQIDRHRNKFTDYIFGGYADWAARSYIPDGWDSEHEYYPYISPLGNEFSTRVPIFIQTGTAEIFHDSHLQFAQKMREKDCEVHLMQIHNAPHDTFHEAEAMGFREEQKRVIDRVVTLVEDFRANYTLN